ncbi:MAG TPA: peptidylprolyl isomerase [Verrucomicrobiae bacterium]
MRTNCTLVSFVAFALALPLGAAPTIDPIPTANIPAGKSLIVPVTASSPNGRPLTFTAVSSTNRITVEVRTNNLFWKMSVVQQAAPGATGSYQIPFRGTVITVTNLGDMTFMLFKDLAPRTVDVFVGLTASGFYNSNTVYHRVIPNFMIQGGDPKTNGTGGPVFRYEDEFHPQAIFSGHGQLALANSGKDTCGSQFFVTQGPQRSLDFGYTLFGQLLRGFNVLTNVINTPRNTSDHPLAEVIITKASLVPNTTDTVLTLAGTNLAGVSGTIRVIADDGAGGRATNTFTAMTVTDTNNAPPLLYPNTVTNLVAPVNGRLTNYFTAMDLNGDAYYWFPQFASDADYYNATNSSYNILANGQLQLFLVPNSNFAGAVKFYGIVSSSSFWEYFPSYFPYDLQAYTFVFGDTAMGATASNFVTQPNVAFTNQLLATFTNGVAGSAVTNFTALINWGDNSTNSGVILTNASGRKEVRGAHTYTNAGTYPVYVTIRSRFGVETTVVATAFVPPNLSQTHVGAQSTLRWPAWATEYQLQSSTNLNAAAWTPVTNLPALVGYEQVATNNSTGSGFFRLKR